MYDLDGPGAPPKRPVRIVVHDKAKHESRTFSCDAMLLRESMQYFTSVLDQLLEVADRSSNTPLSLNVNCDIPIFSWLMEFIQGRQPTMLPTNVVSLILSSNFLLMTPLFQLGLQYLKDHLVEVLLTDVNMDCIPAETVLKLAQRMSEDDIALSLLQLVEANNERCANRSFVTQLLRHIVQQRFCDDPVSLRWCQYCGVLVDAEALRTMHASVSVEIPCPMLGAGRVGSRGEMLQTHEATIAVADNFMTALLQQQANTNNATGMLVQGAGSGLSSSSGGNSNVLGSALSLFQQATGGDAAEAVHWRLIGSLKVYRCDRCDAAVQLIAIRQHDCYPGALTTNITASSNSWKNCIASASQVHEAHLVTLFATVLPTMQPIRKSMGPSNALLSAVVTSTAIANAGGGGGGGGGGCLSSVGTSANMASLYVAPFVEPEDPLPGTGAAAALAMPLIRGPILWKRGQAHTNQAVQADGVPNVEIIRFHETRMFAHMQDYVNSFSRSMAGSNGGGSGSVGGNPQRSRAGGANSGTAAVGQSGGLHRSATFQGRGRLSLGSATPGGGGAAASTNTSQVLQRGGSMRSSQGSRKTMLSLSK